VKGEPEGLRSQNVSHLKNAHLKKDKICGCKGILSSLLSACAQVPCPFQ